MADSIDYRQSMLQWCWENILPISDGEFSRFAWSWERNSQREYSLKFERDSDAAMFILRWSS